jgi:hypothetical protein
MGTGKSFPRILSRHLKSEDKVLRVTSFTNIGIGIDSVSVSTAVSACSIEGGVRMISKNLTCTYFGICCLIL